MPNEQETFDELVKDHKTLLAIRRTARNLNWTWDVPQWTAHVPKRDWVEFLRLLGVSHAD